MTADIFEFDATSEEATARFGRALARALPAQMVVGLDGTLGAGKTRLVQAVAEACGIARRDVTSPTFVLVQEYHGSRTIYHADAYRLRDEDEFLQLGLDEHFDEDVLVFVEWAERIAACLPVERLELRMAVTGEQTRRISVRALPAGTPTPAQRHILERLQNELA
jgi:tRNA threonylcarbamoyladenosine biosynthesis protein TsaE